MTLVANSSGQVSGKFTIPANVSAGSKLAEFIGAGGSYGSSVFFGQGLLQRNTFQEVVTTIQSIGMGSVGGGGEGDRGNADPLAQTFTLSSQTHIGGVDLFVTTKGITPIAIQIRETQVGVPTGVVLAEAQLKPADITINAWNRWEFNRPIVLLSQVEYAIVVLCNDADGAVGIAELGKYDSSSQKWVTSQAYQVGVLLSSSNAVTWTAHQDKDLTFRLLACNYTQAERILDLGNVAVTGATDLIVLAPVIEPASGADSQIVLTMPDTTTLTVSDRQIVRLPAALTGNIGMSVKLRSANGLSASLLPGSQVVAGIVDLSAIYVSRSMDANAAGCTVKVIFDAVIPSGAGVAVHVSGADVGDTFAAASAVGSPKALGDGLYEYQFSLASVMEARVRVKLTLTGTVTARPIVKNLRVSVI